MKRSEVDKTKLSPMMRQYMEIKLVTAGRQENGKIHFCKGKSFL